MIRDWFAHRDRGVWATDGGLEYPLVLTSLAVALAFTGPGSLSLDHLLGWSPAGGGWGLTALGIGIAGWLVGSAARRWSPRSRTGAVTRRTA